MDDQEALARRKTLLELSRVFDCLGRLHHANPQAYADAIDEAKSSLKEKNNRVETDKRYAAIVIDGMVRDVCSVTGYDRATVQLAAEIALLPSKAANLLDLCRAHLNDLKEMRRKDGKNGLGHKATT